MSTVQALRLACERLRLVEVADGLAALSPHAKQDLASLLSLLCPPLCTAFFPRYNPALCTAFYTRYTPACNTEYVSMFKATQQSVLSASANL